jgi:hypothetical protein
MSRMGCFFSLDNPMFANIRTFFSLAIINKTMNVLINTYNELLLRPSHHGEKKGNKILNLFAKLFSLY